MTTNLLLKSLIIVEHLLFINVASLTDFVCSLLSSSKYLLSFFKTTGYSSSVNNLLQACVNLSNEHLTIPSLSSFCAVTSSLRSEFSKSAPVFLPLLTVTFLAFIVTFLHSYIYLCISKSALFAKSSSPHTSHLPLSTFTFSASIITSTLLSSSAFFSSIKPKYSFNSSS